MQGAINELLNIVQNPAGWVFGLSAFVYTCVRISKTYWEAKKVRLEVADLANRVSSHKISGKPMQRARRRGFTKMDSVIILLLLGDLIWISARLAITETISRIDLIASLWAAAGLGVCVAFLLSILVMDRVVELTELILVLVNALAQEKGSNTNVDPKSVSDPSSTVTPD